MTTNYGDNLYGDYLYGGKQMAMSDKELSEAAWLELTKTTDPYPTWKKKGFPTSSHWAIAKGFLDQIGVTPTPPPPPPPPPPPSGMPRAGYSVGGRSLWRSDADHNFELDQIAACGAKIVRVDVDPVPSHMDAVDKFIAGVFSRGMEPLLILGGWLKAPLSDSAWRTFCGQCRDRYTGKGVRLFETPNEPNNGTGFTPQILARHAVIAYEEIKKANNVLLGVGALSLPATSILQWAKDMYGAGLAGHLDAFSVHAYNDPADHGSWSAHDCTLGHPTYYPDPNNIKAVMKANGDGNKGIWTTESGDTVSKISLSKQALTVTNVLHDQRYSLVLIYTMLDDDVPGFGMLDPSRQKRPAWDAFKAAVS